MSDRPTVSIVMPTYNRARVLPRAVRSVLGQTYADFELIIVDDGSIDDTRATIDAFSDDRIRAIYAPHAGLSPTRNRAIAAARGDWVAFLDDDNEWLPECLERQLAVVERMPSVGAVYCSTAVRMQDSPEVSSARWPESFPTGDVFAEILEGWWTPISSLMVRRATLIDVGGFWDELPVFDDLDVMLRVALHTSFACSPGVGLIREERALESPRVLDNMSRTIGKLDRRWRRRIVAHAGARAYLRWISVPRRFVIRKELAWLYGDDSPRRARALSSLRRLTRLLPWSAVAVTRALVVFALSARADERLRAWMRRVRRAARAVVR